MSCPACGTEQPPGSRFCNQCGTTLAVACAQCGAQLPSGSRFCNSCGAPAAASAPADPAPEPTGAHHGERSGTAQRRVTSVLFCDLVGFTTLSEERDHEETRELLSQYFDEARRTVARYGGTVEKFIGDAVMAVWGVPTAHEDDAERAVRAGLELVTRVADMGSDLGVAGLAARVGIVTGEVAVTLGASNQGMVAGDAVNTASRVQSVAGPGQVWVDETTRLLTSGAITYTDAGTHTLKGKAEPIALWSARAVVAARGGAQRPDGLEAPVVGRDRELRLVKELFHSVESSGRPALLLIDGEAGVGKTRLAWEYEKYMDGLSSTVMWHTGRCPAYGEGVAFRAVAEAVRGRLSALADDDDDRDLLLLFLDTHRVPEGEREWLRPRLEVLLGTSEHQFPKEDLFAAWTTFFEYVGDASTPVVLVIDDAQHSEDGLLEFVEHLITWAAYPLFVVLVSRPGLVERRVSLATHPNSTVIHLGGLDEERMSALLDGLVSGLPAATRRALVARTEGMPLYAVETVRSLIDRDLVIPRGGVYVLATEDPLDLETIGAPASLQAIVAARLDTLTPDERRVVDVASVLGSAISRERIVGLCPDVEDIDGALRQLLHQQIFTHESSRLSSDFGRYAFQQNVVRQVAYATLSLRDRKAIHLAVIASFGRPDEVPADHAPVLAQHHLDAIALLPGDDDVPALRRTASALLLVAARRARALGLVEEGVDHLRSALAQEVDPLVRAATQVELSGALIDAALWDEAAVIAKEAAETFAAADDDASAASAWAKYAAVLSRQQRVEEAERVAWPLWERFRDDPTATRTALDLSEALLIGYGRREFDDRMLRVLDDEARLAEKLGDPARLAQTVLSMGLRYMDQGVATLAMTLLETSAQIARENQLPLHLARALLNLCASTVGSDAERAVGFGREAVVASRRTGVLMWSSVSALNHGLALWVRGDWDDLRRLLEAESRWSPGGDQVSAVAIDMMLAVATGEEPRQVLAIPDPRELLADFDKGWAHFARALRLTAAGETAAALREAVLATQTYGGVYDDFLHMWELAADLAAATDDRDEEARIVEAVDSVNAALPLGLRAHRARVAARMADRDGTAPAEVERLLHEARDLYDEWGALAYRARTDGELGEWLLRQGRTDEAEPLLAASRTTLQGLGARTWLAALTSSADATH